MILHNAVDNIGINIEIYDKTPVMLAIILVAMLAVILILLLLNVPISQRAINIILVVFMMLLVIVGAGWFNSLRI